MEKQFVYEIVADTFANENLEGSILSNYIKFIYHEIHRRTLLLENHVDLFTWLAKKENDEYIVNLIVEKYNEMK